MPNEEQQPTVISPTNDHVEEVMGPTVEESKPVSVPNESALAPSEVGEVVVPEESVQTDHNELDSEPAEATETSDSPDQDSLEEDVNSNEESVKEEPKPNNTIGLSEKIKHAWRKYWRLPHAKLYTAAGITTFILLISLVPFSRYFLLNLVGVRSSMSISLYDETTKQPLKNVQITARGMTVVTGSDGKATFQHIKLGRTRLDIKRRAFAPVQKTITLGWGSNPLGNLELKPVGAQYSFLIIDALSSKPIEKAEAGSDDLASLSDKDGKLVFTVDGSSDQDLQITITANGYRKEKVTINNDTNKTQTVKMIPGRKQPFISKQSGRFDLYSTDIDGKNETVVLKATGNEQPEIGLIAHPTDEVAALVSTRDNIRNKDGFLQQTLTFVDLSDNTTRTITHSERIQVIGWIESKLVYAQITAGASAANAARQKLNAYDYKTQKTEQLASSNSFNDLLVKGKDVFYAPSNAFTPNAPAGFYKISPEATNKQSVLDKEVWNLFRTDYNNLTLSVQQDWYQYKLGSTDKPTKLPSAPANIKNRIYSDSPDGKNSLWIDERDGKGTLLLYDLELKSDKVIAAQAGLDYPVRWLSNNSVVYRIHTPQETADYVLNIEGGKAVKIRDVTQTEGMGRWYYY